MYKTIENSYDSFKEARIKERAFSYELWLRLIDEWKQSPLLDVSEIGQTYEGKPIHQVKFGVGPIHICAWSQMHGDEATATMALADIFLFYPKMGVNFLNLGKNCIRKLHYLVFLD